MLDVVEQCCWLVLHCAGSCWVLLDGVGEFVMLEKVRSAIGTLTTHIPACDHITIITQDGIMICCIPYWGTAAINCPTVTYASWKDAPVWRLEA